MAGTDITEQVRTAVAAGNARIVTEFPVEEVAEPDFDGNLLLREEENGRIVVGYLVRDPEPTDYWEDADGRGELTVFNDQGRRDAHLEQLEADGQVALLVDRYSHSGDHFSVADTRSYPDRRWDVATSGVFVPCDEVQRMYREKIGELGEAAAKDWLVTDSNAILDEYSRAVNGEVFGVIVETWEVDGGFSRRIDQEASWGTIGLEHAVSALRDIMPAVDDTPEPA